MNDFKTSARTAWLEIQDEAMQLRQEIHEWPELGYKEFETTRRIKEFLTRHCVDCQTFESLTGVVAYIDNQQPFTVALRVDIDALPLEENTGVAYSSKNRGVMHACGHDMHTSIGATTAVMLNRLKDKIPVNVKIIFQPAEECSPRGGARDMKDLGVLKEHDISYMLGFHVWPEYKLGEIGIRPGPMMASSDKFRITVNGAAGHAAQPHKATDAIIIASDILNAIYKILPRRLDAFKTYVLTIGEMVSRGRYNIVSDHVDMMGTLRTLDNETRVYIHDWLSETVRKLADAYGGKAEVIFDQGYDVVVNDQILSEVFTRYGKKHLGEASVITSNPPSLIAEDFSVFSNEIPSVYFHLGCGCRQSLHSDKFFASEETLEIGAGLLCSFLLSEDFADFIKNYKS